MAISGNIRTMPFPDLMQWISMSRKTGTLVIKGQRFTKKILFTDGTVSAVTSNNPREHLGYYLVGWGYLSEIELQGFLERQRERRMMLGELLVQAGRMTRADVTRVVQVKTEQTIFDLMLWAEGEFFFVDDNQPRREFQELALPVDHFIFEGARQADERRRMSDRIPDSQHVPRVARQLDLSKLEDDARTIVGAIDGRRTIEQVALASRMTEFDVLSFLYQGIAVGAFELRSPAGPPEPIPGAARATWQDLLREAENSVALGDLLEAFRHLRRLRERFGGVAAANEAAFSLEAEIEREIDKTPLASNVILELAVPLQDVTRLNCSPDEGFVLSRINGVYTLPQVLAQLPGSRLSNMLIVHSLLQRGVIKLRESQAVARYQGPKKTGFY